MKRSHMKRTQKRRSNKRYTRKTRRKISRRKNSRRGGGRWKKWNPRTYYTQRKRAKKAGIEINRPYESWAGDLEEREKANKELAHDALLAQAERARKDAKEENFKEEQRKRELVWTARKEEEEFDKALKELNLGEREKNVLKDQGVTTVEMLQGMEEDDFKRIGIILDPSYWEHRRKVKESAEFSGALKELNLDKNAKMILKDQGVTTVEMLQGMEEDDFEGMGISLERPSKVRKIRAEIEEIYKTYTPRDMPTDHDMDTIFSKFKGQEEKLLTLTRKKYVPM